MGSKKYRNRPNPKTALASNKTWTPPMETEKDRTIKAYIRDATRGIRGYINSFVAETRNAPLEWKGIKVDPLLRATLCNVINAFGQNMAANCETLDALPGGINIERLSSLSSDDAQANQVVIEKAIIMPGADGLSSEDLKIPLVEFSVLYLTPEIEKMGYLHNELLPLGNDAPLRQPYNRWIGPVPDEDFRTSKVLIPLVYLVAAGHVGIRCSPHPVSWCSEVRDSGVVFSYVFERVAEQSIAVMITVHWDTIVDMVKRVEKATRPN